MGLAGSQKAILMFGMICSGFLTAAERMELRALARDGLSEARVARRAQCDCLVERRLELRGSRHSFADRRRYRAIVA